MTIHLIRHGQSVDNLSPEIVFGRNNPAPLSALGVMQAQALGVRYKTEGFKPDRVVSSIAVRARQTAEEVCKLVGFPTTEIEQTELLVELDQGQWEGRLRSEVYTKKVYEQIKKLKEHFKAPDGESQYELEKRMKEWFEQNANPKEEIAIFSHGFSIRLLIKSIMNFKQANSYPLQIHNTGVSRLTHHNGEWCVQNINDTRHLSDEMLTR